MTNRSAEQIITSKKASFKTLKFCILEREGRTRLTNLKEPFEGIPRQMNKEIWVIWSCGNSQRHLKSASPKHLLESLAVNNSPKFLSWVNDCLKDGKRMERTRVPFPQQSHTEVCATARSD